MWCATVKGSEDYGWKETDTFEISLQSFELAAQILTFALHSLATPANNLFDTETQPSPGTACLTLLTTFVIWKTSIGTQNLTFFQWALLELWLSDVLIAWKKGPSAKVVVRNLRPNLFENFGLFDLDL